MNLYKYVDHKGEEVTLSGREFCRLLSGSMAPTLSGTSQAETILNEFLLHYRNVLEKKVMDVSIISLFRLGFLVGFAASKYSSNMKIIKETENENGDSKNN